jgi:hypothetical protein
MEENHQVLEIDGPGPTDVAASHLLRMATTNFWLGPGQDTIGPGLSRHLAISLFNASL